MHFGLVSKFLVLVVLVGAIVPLQAQEFTRIEADVSIKQLNADGSSSLTRGRVYYDQFAEQIVYDLHFPHREIIVVRGPYLYRIENDSIASKDIAPNLTRHSVFHLALNGNLQWFGLKNSAYTLDSVEHDGDMVISTWLPPKKDVVTRGKILLAQNDKQLVGLISYNDKDELIGRQLFRNYLLVQDVQFPGEVLQILYQGSDESKQLTSYSNIKLNATSNDALYHYVVPGL